MQNEFGDISAEFITIAFNKDLQGYDYWILMAYNVFKATKTNFIPTIPILSTKKITNCHRREQYECVQELLNISQWKDTIQSISSFQAKFQKKKVMVPRKRCRQKLRSIKSTTLITNKFTTLKVKNKKTEVVSIQTRQINHTHPPK